MSDELPSPVFLSDRALVAVIGTLDDRSATDRDVDEAERVLIVEARRRGLDFDV